MKKLGAVLLGASLVAGAAVWAANTATSVNIVGFNTIVAERSKLVMVSTAFNSMNGAPLLSSNVFGGQGLPTGTKIYVYDPLSASYISDGVNFLGQWGTNITYKGGMGFWLSIPATAPTNIYNVVLNGEVPLADQATNTVYNGLTMLGYPYTASVLWTNTSLAKTAVSGDKLYLYDSSTGNYISNGKNFLGNWSVPGMVINQGQGFWFSTSRALFTNVENKPY